MLDIASPKPRASRPIAVASWTAVVGWMGVIFYLSSRTGITVWNPMSYVAHFMEYTILGVLLCAALYCSTSLSGRALLIVALVIASAYGISDEFHQSFVPTREVSVWDWLTDTAGASAALLVWTGMVRARAGKGPLSGV